ncbi:hypothetical protein ERJ75_001609600 [Trypanosoma vivax]|uniref:Serine protease n=1 Tax=Trypanosoma vivax (strain Y486) TaxID=1055687 RepID=G0TSW8_TRYVY|nr:hypothetical protein TRVL_06004 [Trypanosoma vivax]KAH8605800.1 hypothetical protein ERJ75_001609600 [Trypanosoma vivax]CCC47047.1 conserved hypothetical protein [Trypanosoma vivax Y486]
MFYHGPVEPPAAMKPSAKALNAMHALYWRENFLGTCFAIGPRVIITAGHHYNAAKDDVGEFSLRSPSLPRSVFVEYAAKNSVHDLLVLWVDMDVEHVDLRAFLPPIQARVATVWLSTKWPHQDVVSPGVVVESSVDSCLARGTVSTTGSSGAPVIDCFGDHIVGMHLTSDTRDGSRVSGFLPSRKIVSILSEMGVASRS